MSDKPKQNEERGLIDHNSLMPPGMLLLNVPRRLFFFFLGGGGGDGFRCSVCLFIVLIVRHKSRKQVNIDV